MADGVNQIAEDQTTPETVVETPLGAKEFRGGVEHKDPFAPELKPAPDGVPEPFWDPVKGEVRTDALLKSYSDLRKKMDGGSKDDPQDPPADPQDPPADPQADPQDPPADPQDDPQDPPADPDTETLESPEFAAAADAAAKVYAETRELPEEARAPLKKLGVTDQQIDFYLAGIKAQEAALETAAHKAAGGKEAYEAAVAWAAQGGLTAKQITAFNTQTSDVELIGPAVAGLMASFKAANPEASEGKLLNINAHTASGDVYTNMDEFQQDLSKADQLRDTVARRKAIEKLRRSREAGTVKSERRSPFGN